MGKKTPVEVAKMDDKTNGGQNITELSFDYIKSNLFRVVHVDGVHGGIAPNGHTIQMAMFSERSPIPKSETYELKEGRLGERKSLEKRDALIREVEIETLMDINTAKKIVQWLEDKIAVAEEIRKEAQP